MNKTIITSVLFFFLIAGLFSGCRTKQQTAKAPDKGYDVDFLLEKMKENQFQFQTLSMKASVSLSSNNSFDGASLSGTIRMIRDSIIWMSFSPGLGIEAARLYITQDSVFFLNQLTNQYVASSFNFFTAYYQVDVDFNILQSLILGNDFDYYEYSKFKSSFDNGRYRLAAQERRKQKKYIRNNDDIRRVLVQTTWLNADHFKVESMNIQAIEDQQRKLQVDYSGFTTIEGQLFPQKESFQVLMKETGKNQKLALSVGFSKIELNKEVATPFNISSKYKRIEL